jgi:membrane-bound lytic murein transglycosylase MltF
VLALTNSTTYFVYRGEPLGYEYELLQSFATIPKGCNEG